MKFRAPTDTPIRVALTSGHVTLITSEWQELDERFHRDALAQGAQAQTNFVENKTTAKADTSSTKVLDTESAIRDAIVVMLERDDPSDFVASTGMPNLKALEKQLGFRVERDTVYNVFAEMKAQ